MLAGAPALICKRTVRSKVAGYSSFCICINQKTCKFVIRMPEIIIKYSDSKTLKVLKTLSQYLNFTLSTPSKKGKKEFFINGVPAIPGDSSIDISEMKEIFTGRNIDAKKLRQKAWQRSR